MPWKSVYVLVVYPFTSRRLRVYVGIAHGFAGVILMMVFARAMSGSVDLFSVSYLGSCICGLVSGYVFAGLYGHNNDVADWLSCFVGATLASALGSLLGGAMLGVWLALGSAPPTLLEALLISAFTAPAMVMTLVPSEHPILMVVWYVLVIAIQVAATKWRLRGI